MSVRARRKRSCLGAIVALAGLLPVAAAVDEGFPDPRPSTRAQAVGVVSGGGTLPIPCLTPLLRGTAGDTVPVALRRALSVLERPALLHGERRLVSSHGVIVRYTTSRGVFDRVDARDDDRDGMLDVVQSALDGLNETRELLIEGLALPEPRIVEVLLAHIGQDLDGYTLPAAADGSRARIVLEATRRDPEEVRRAAIHQYAHAVAQSVGDGVPAAWSEALATWSVMRLTGGPDAETAELLSERLHRLSEGLLADDLRLSAGNAAWLAFLEESYGPIAVRLVVEELASGAPAEVALDRALGRAAGESLSSAFREFQLWSLLVGDRATGGYLPFADRLASPRFAERADGLPALSLRGEEPLAGWGGAFVLLRPGDGEGGLHLNFDGDFSTPWAADLLLIGRTGALHRLPLGLSTEGRGEATVPLHGVAEAVLMIRNLGGDGAARYRWAVDREKGYPFELATLEAAWSTGRSGGVIVYWETSSERDLIGFNVVRSDAEGNSSVRINPVWIPAVGGESELTSYQFLDLGADPNASHGYRIEALTENGLTSVSEAVLAPAQTPAN